MRIKARLVLIQEGRPRPWRWWPSLTQRATHQIVCIDIASGSPSIPRDTALAPIWHQPNSPFPHPWPCSGGFFPLMRLTFAGEPSDLSF
ncbi:hypothetical protein KC19_8G067200 [Ceratodon purpureus]|uniref:Uncharacterized protein n=1 Tax=Ceratodon purpureus TaxID=3225 RepID=A0A8T0GW43_CERPU|nr:hypothetical protein KC19_8G067200 [Ceratodon purpureus]